MIDFKKIKWNEQDQILITMKEHPRSPVLILDAEQIERLNKAWRG